MRMDAAAQGRAFRRRSLLASAIRLWGSARHTNAAVPSYRGEMQLTILNAVLCLDLIRRFPYIGPRGAASAGDLHPRQRGVLAHGGPDKNELHGRLRQDD